MKVIQRVVAAAAVCILTLTMLFLQAFPAAASAYEAIQAKIPVTCLEISEEATHIYDIRIEPADAQSPAPESGALAVSENRTEYFVLDITEPGTFSYKVYEAKGDDPNIQYDTDIYIVSIYVTADEFDQLSYSVIVNLNGKNLKSEEVDFQNSVSESEGSRTTTTTTATTAASTVTTVTTTAATTTQPAQTDNSVSAFIQSVLTGDSFPVFAAALLLISLTAIAVSVFLFKCENREEEDKHGS